MYALCVDFAVLSALTLCPHFFFLRCLFRGGGGGQALASAKLLVIIMIVTNAI